MTKENLRNYIKEELGWPQIQVELTDNQLNHCIDKSVKMFANHAVEAESREYIMFKCNGRGEYKVSPDVEEIIRITDGQNIFAMSGVDGLVDEMLPRLIMDAGGSAVGFLISISSTRSLMNKYFEKTIHYDYNPYKRKLYIHENFQGNLLIEARLRYVPDEDDMIYEQEWVQRMSVAQSRMLLSTVLGKYNANIVGGATINYGDMRSLAENEIQKLEEELLSKWQSLPPVMVV